MVFFFASVMLCPNCEAVIHGYDLSMGEPALAVIKCGNCGKEYELTYDPKTKQTELREKRVH